MTTTSAETSAPTFRQFIMSLPPEKSLGIGDCTAGARLLVQELDQRVIAQRDLTRRVVETFVTRGHALLEGMPGLAKTAAVEWFAMSTGLRFRWVQFRPDMMPGDLIGRYQFMRRKHRKGETASEPRKGETDLELRWRYGPVYSSIMVADEINRASPRSQAVLLETMQLRQVSRIDRERAEPLYHPRDRAELRRMRDAGTTCFGVAVPDPDDRDQTLNSVFGTENPIEVEGTYPLSEAQENRFLFKVEVPDLPFDSYKRVIERNLERDRTGFTEWPRPDDGGPPGWVRVLCFFTRMRELLYTGLSSTHWTFLRDQRGLLDRLRLLIMLTHYRHRSRGTADLGGGGEGSGSANFHIDQFLDDWCRSQPDGLGPRVRTLLTNKIFGYVESGVSPRGLIDLPRAAIAEALLDGAVIDDGTETLVLRRRHFRSVAGDVLRHRVRLTPAARIEGLTTGQLIDFLAHELFPDVAGDVDGAAERKADQAELFK